LIGRALIFFIIGLSIFDQAHAKTSDKGFYIGAAYSSKWVDGTGTIDSKHFDITAPIIDSIFFSENSFDITVRVVTNASPGYGLNSKYFGGFGLTTGYRFSSKLAISLSYDDYSLKIGDEFYSYNGLPDGYFSNHAKVIKYILNYHQQDFQLMIEYHFTHLGIYLSAGVEWMYSTLTVKRYDYHYIDSAVNDVYFFNRNSYMNNFMPFLGLNYEYFILPKISINCKSSYSFINFAGGLKLNAGIRAYIF